MQTARKIVHSSQLYPLHNGQAILRYVGYRYPESQWVGLVDKHHTYSTKLTEIGHIILETEATGPIYELEQKLLTMAKIYGANVVLIDYLKSFEVKNAVIKKLNSGVQICGRCQRFDV